MSTLKRDATCIAAMLLATVLFFTACKKEAALSPGQNTRKLSVYLTDDPCQYDSVLIDIRYVEVKVDTSREHMGDDEFGDHDDNGDDDHEHHDGFGVWDTLSITAGVYNVMNLRNGIDALLGTANIPAGAIRKIRITLGPDNSVFIGGVSTPLNLLPGVNNYVYIRIHDEDIDDDNNNARTWLDFDVCRSIVLYNGQYYLRPFFRPFCSGQMGEIEGKVLPGEAHPLVKAFNSTDSATAIPGDEGEYKIRGLKEGTYDLLFDASNGYQDTVVSNISVVKGHETKVPLVTLHK